MSCIYDARSFLWSDTSSLTLLCQLPAPASTQVNGYNTALCSLSGSWDWIKNLLSFVPKADSKIVQLDLFFFSFIFILKSVSLSLHFHRPLGQHAYMGF